MKAQHHIIYAPPFASRRMRRLPKQDRSRARLENILKVAQDLLVQKGVDSVTMREIADLTGGPIASVYQYFPDKSAIIGELYRLHIKEIATLLDLSIRDLSDKSEIIDVALSLLESYIDYLRVRPPAVALLEAVGANKTLSKLHLRITLRQTRLFFGLTREYVEGSRHQQYLQALALLAHMAPTAGRLATDAHPLGSTELVSEFKSIISSKLVSFLESDLSEPFTRRTGS